MNGHLCEEPGCEDDGVIQLGDGWWCARHGYPPEDEMADLIVRRGGAEAGFLHAFGRLSPSQRRAVWASVMLEG